MNEGRICISVRSRKAERFVSRARAAAALANTVELRFDSLRESEIAKARDGLKRLRREYGGIIIATFRTSENGQGGERKLSREERIAFWQSRFVRDIADWADIEFDLDAECLRSGGEYAFDRIIRSYHQFDQSPGDADAREILARMRSSHPPDGRFIIKIAVTSSDITDSIPIWKLLESGAGRDSPIAISMGEFGAWTRILGPAFGSPLTYAASQADQTTAPGQFSFEDVSALYRVTELDRSTSVYGITGYPARHSTSPYLHNAAFRALRLNSVYLPLPARDLAAFYRRMISPATREIGWNLKGISVTHPHKEAIVPMLDRLDPVASGIGAVNTVSIDDGIVSGHNTDAEGFIRSLKDSSVDPNGSAAGIIGTGGAAKAACFGLLSAGADVKFFSRNPPKGGIVVAGRSVPAIELTASEDCFSGIDLLVNATPQGTRGPLMNETPAVARQMQNLQFAFDMVYNPPQTRFLREAASAGISATGGLSMLINQAVRQFEIWTGLAAPMEVMAKAAADQFRFPPAGQDPFLP